MKTITLLIITIVLIIVPVGFFYYISVNGFSTYHAGIYVELLSEENLERLASGHKPNAITQEELEQFPQIHTMVNLLLEEKENSQGTRSFFVGFDTYRVFDSRGELKIKNHMSDSGASNLYRDFTQSIGSHVFRYDGNYFSVSHWIA